MKKSRIRVLVLVLLLALGATSMFGNPDQEVYVDYFTDNTYTVQCGHFYITCTGNVRQGCITEYEIVTEGMICW